MMMGVYVDSMAVYLYLFSCQALLESQYGGINNKNMKKHCVTLLCDPFHKHTVTETKGPLQY